ncbi:MAG: S8 family serine peptidase [Nostocoides sp.]
MVEPDGQDARSDKTASEGTAPLAGMPVDPRMVGRLRAGTTAGAARRPDRGAAGGSGESGTTGGGAGGRGTGGGVGGGDPEGSAPATLYVRDRLLHQGWTPDVNDVLTPLAEALAKTDLSDRVVVSTPSRGPEARLGRLDGELARLRDEIWVSPIVLESILPGYAVDAWQVLQAIRAVDPGLGATIMLDHVVVAGGGDPGGIGGDPGGIGGDPGGIGGDPGGIGGARGLLGSIGEYSVPGYGGCSPVHLPMVKPRSMTTKRRPVVALPDTGLDLLHPWFAADPSVGVGATFDGLPIGGLNVDLSIAPADALVGRLPRLAGHGTFVAGIVRQACPDAAILSIPVLGGNGYGDAVSMRQALALLLLRHAQGVLDNVPSQLIDVLSMSFGYYPETTDDPADERSWRLHVRRFVEWGVTVVAGVGNDASVQRFIPAAFTEAFGVGPEDAAVDLLSVGARNPNRASIALFSNAGSWVLVHRPGAAVVSTMPTGLKGGAQASQLGADPCGQPRSTMNPQDYSGGFGVWSGTSFSTPVVAGECAAAIVEGDDADACERSDLVGRSLVARTACLKVGWPT